MARIRIAQRGWTGSRAAETAEEIDMGVRFLWMEIDGCRIEDVIEANVKVSNGFTAPTVETVIFGPVEMVYVLADGSEAFSRFATDREVPSLNHQAITNPAMLSRTAFEAASKIARDAVAAEHEWIVDSMMERLNTLGYLYSPEEG